MIVLGIESSCDETAAAVVKDGKTVMSSVVASQVDVHHKYGGVVPELASRKHIEAIVPVVEEAIEKAGILKGDIDAVAVTQGPGLVGALLVGFSFAKAFAYSLKIPLIGVNHLEGHMNSVFLMPEPPRFPFTALLVSGGHTSLYNVLSHTEYEQLGQTRDDAVGEAYDKVSKMLGLGYPGGKVIDDLAAEGDPEKIKFPRPFLDKNGFDFSFSGLKSAVGRYLETHSDEVEDSIPDIAAGFQQSVIEVLSWKVINATVKSGCDHLAIVGGVAANSGLRRKVTADAAGHGLKVHIPPLDLCGDNAAMIGAVGYHYLVMDDFSGLNDDVYSRAKKLLKK